MIPKFRGLPVESNDEENWKYGYLIEDGREAFIINQVIEATEQYIVIGSWEPVRPKTVSQSTGLKDKNGKEIFEGDIVRQVRTQPTTENETIIGVVTMLEGAWLIMNDGERLASYLWSETDETKILGNIYKNSELLK